MKCSLSASMDFIKKQQWSQMAQMYRHPQTKNDVVATIIKEYANPIFVSKNNAEYHVHSVLVGDATRNGKLHVDGSIFPTQME